MTEEYKKEGFLREEYWKNDKSLQEIGDSFGVNRGTIKYYMDEHDIPTRRANSEKAGYYWIDSSGYPRFQVCDGGEIKRIRIHRLLAVAKYGFENVKNKSVHHKNGVKWDNRCENIEIMTRSEHTKLHRN